LKREGVLLVVSGPSGVGKGALIRELMRRRPEVRKSVSCTTRPPRPGEREGEDYCFVSAQDFSRMRQRGEFLEWAVVHEDLAYGTPRGPVEAALASGQDIILEIDYQGARAVRQQFAGRAALVFVAPPSWAELRARLTGRGSEASEDVQTRLRSAHREIANIGLFGYVVVNQDVPRAAEELGAILVAERARLPRVCWRELQAEILAGAGVESQ